MEVNRAKKAVGFVVKQDLHPLGVVLMKEQKDLFADEGYRGFIESSIEADGSVFGHPASGAFSEGIIERFGSQADTLGVIGKPPQGALAG